MNEYDQKIDITPEMLDIIQAFDFQTQALLLRTLLCRKFARKPPKLNKTQKRILETVMLSETSSQRTTIQTNTFLPPTIEEVKMYIMERNLDVDAVKWWNFYNAKGWMIGKNKMKNWKSAVNTWARLDSQRTNKNVNNGTQAMQYGQLAARATLREIFGETPSS